MMAAQILSRESVRCQVETGGTLFGYRHGRVIAVATGPGPKALKQACKFSADVEFQQQALERITAKTNGRCKLMGYWHRHPGNMGHPSPGDQAQAREIAADFSNNNGACNLVAIITTVDLTRRKVLLHTFVFNPSSNKLEKARISILSNDSPILSKARKAEPSVITTRKADLFNEPNFRFHETLMGEKRIRSEVKELEAHGFHVSVSKRKEDNRALMVVQAPNGSRLIVVPPIEYPLNPPRVFELPHGNEWHGSFCPSTLHWNSDRRIVDLLRTEFKDNSAVALTA